MGVDHRIITDLGILIARLGIGWIMVAHGWQKFFVWGLEGTAAAMGEGGVPLPLLSAAFTAFVELVGGAALVAGAAVRPAALGMAFVMAGAFVFVQGGNGVYMENDGYGFVLSIAVCCLLLAATGSGRFGVDHLVVERLRARHGRRGSRERAAA